MTNAVTSPSGTPNARWSARSRLAASLAATAIAAVFACGLGAAATVPGPDPARMTLQVADFPGAHAEGQGEGDSYERVIRLAHPYGRSRYVLFDSLAIVTPDAAAGAALYHRLGRQLSSRSIRVAVIQRLVVQAGLAQSTKGIRLLRPRALGVHDSSMEAGFVVELAKRKLDVSITLVRVDRVIEANLALGIGPMATRADGIALSALVAGHIADGLIPVGLGQPILTGVAETGQTLTASSGSWRGSTTTFAYQWQRCDAAGVTCADVPGATNVYYRVTDADRGATLRAHVIAANRFGSGSALSAVSAVVP